jgi:phosphonate transport system substrate-binding protein
MNNNLIDKSHASFPIILLVASMVFSILACTGCDRQESAPPISLQQQVAAPETVLGDLNGDSVKIAVAAMISPKETFHSYKKLLNFISEQLGRPVQLIQRKTYQEVNDLLQESRIDAGFICTGAYVTGHNEFGMELLVAPVVNGATVYHSYIIVNRDSDINELAGLQNKVFAFTDPLSNTGKAAPTDMLARIGTAPETFFSETIFTYSHDNSIKAVAHNVVDGAAVDSLVWEYLHRTTPGDTSQTRIIAKSEPYGIPPVVIAKGIDSSLRQELLAVFLNIHKDPAGKEILNDITIERFVVVSDSIYDSVRKMNRDKTSK